MRNRPTDDPLREIGDTSPVPHRPPHRCPTCGYDVGGLPTRCCSECGTVFTLDDARRAAIETEHVEKPSEWQPALGRRLIRSALGGVFFGVLVSRLPFVAMLGYPSWVGPAAFGVMGLGCAFAASRAHRPLARSIVECLCACLSGAFMAIHGCRKLSPGDMPPGMTPQAYAKMVMFGAIIGFLAWVGLRLPSR